MKKILVSIFLTISLLLTPIRLGETAVQDDFINLMAPIAQEIIPGYGLWPSIFLAQAALESGWGKSFLAQYANNYFGRKCLELPCLEINTPEYRRAHKTMENHYFQMYPTIQDAIHGYCKQFFRRYANDTPVYPELNAATPETFLWSIGPRYATDPDYIIKVWEIVQKYDLTRFDQQVEGRE